MQIYITFGLYLAIILGIGLYAYRSTKNFDDYILGCLLYTSPSPRD